MVKGFKDAANQGSKLATNKQANRIGNANPEFFAARKNKCINEDR